MILVEIAAFLIALGLLLVLLIVLRIQSIAAGSLPKLSGNHHVAGLNENEFVRIETDQDGVPRIIADSVENVVYGLGYAHARDRFFQMDLARRYAAGELAEIFGGGKSIVENDRNIRRHRFRNLCKTVVEGLNETDRRYLEKYTSGVNQALRDLRKKPWEYFLLKSNPEAWKPEDSLLVSQSIYLFLEGSDLGWHRANGLIHDILPKELAEFLTGRGSGWDSPVQREAFTAPPIPSPDAVNLRSDILFKLAEENEPWNRLETKVLGSNAWLVSGPRAHGGKSGPGLLANDMHLGFSLPPAWYKVSLVTTHEKSNAAEEVHGVTLPGGPPMVAGSNGRISWGLTSAQGDWGDLLVLEIDPQNPRKYKTPDGWAQMQAVRETIRVKGGSDIEITIDWTIWGPVVDTDLQGRPRVWRWVAQENEGVNLKIAKIAHCNSVDEALSLAAECGVPHVNFLVADAEGHIGWTILGRIPRRVGAGRVDERRPMPAAEPDSAWDGYLNAGEAPKIFDPPGGLIWSANHRMAGGEILEKIGQGRYDRGVRATRIHQLLSNEKQPDEAAMLRIQMDNTDLLLRRWCDRFLKELTDNAISLKSDRSTFRQHLLKWSGRADANSTAYALLNECRLRVVTKILSPLTAPIRQAEINAGRERLQFALRHIGLETPVWAILEQEPAHLLSPKYNAWPELILEAVDETIEHAVKKGWPSWGEVNALRLSHPFAAKMKLLRPILSAPVIHSSGALTDMPKIQSPEFGASQRLAVFPGREQNAIMQLPGGQSAHPMSPHFMDLVPAWASGGNTPLAAGEAVHLLILRGRAGG